MLHKNIILFIQVLQDILLLSEDVRYPMHVNTDNNVHEYDAELNKISVNQIAKYE